MKNRLLCKYVGVTETTLTMIIWGERVTYCNHKTYNDPIVIFYPNNSTRGIDITDSVLACQFYSDNSTVCLWIDIKTDVRYGRFNVYSSKGIWVNSKPFFRSDNMHTIHEIVLVK